MHGIIVSGQFLKFTSTTSQQTGETSHYIHVLVDAGDKPQVMKIKTQRPAVWSKAQKGDVQVSVSLFTPNDSPAIYFSEVVQ